jgi:hypothetical protein
LLLPRGGAGGTVGLWLHPEVLLLMEISLHQDFRAIYDDPRRMAEEHHIYTAQLEAILAKPYPTEEDRLEAARLKKLKLRVKDRMQTAPRGYSPPPSAA